MGQSYLRRPPLDPPRSVVDLFDDYEQPSVALRTSAPFLCECKGQLSLHFDKVGVQSLMDTHNPNRLMLCYTRTIMNFRRFQARPKCIGMVGLGGGSLVKHCLQQFPKASMMVAEISPEVIALRDQFHIPKDGSRLQVTCEDGVVFVKRSRGAFDVLIIDGFDSTGQPADLCSSEFYDSCRDALTRKGVLAVNICDSGRSMMIPRLRRSFNGQVVVMDGEASTNTIAFAGHVQVSDRPISRRPTL